MWSKRGINTIKTRPNDVNFFFMRQTCVQNANTLYLVSGRYSTCIYMYQYKARARLQYILVSCNNTE